MVADVEFLFDLDHVFSWAFCSDNDVVDMCGHVIVSFIVIRFSVPEIRVSAGGCETDTHEAFGKEFMEGAASSFQTVEGSFKGYDATTLVKKFYTSVRKDFLSNGCSTKSIANVAGHDG